MPDIFDLSISDFLEEKIKRKLKEVEELRRQLQLLNGWSFSHLGQTKFVYLNLKILSKQASSFGYISLKAAMVKRFIN